MYKRQDEYTAFKTYAKLYPEACILLVDTYDVLASGVPNAIRVFKEMRAEEMCIRDKYVELNYGKSYLSESEQARVNRKFCIGIHKNCILYLTDGILQNPVIKNNQDRFSQMQFEKNKAYYGNNHWIIKRNISVSVSYTHLRAVSIV